MKRFFIPLAQILVTVGLLGWIFRDPEKNRQMLEGLQNARVVWLLPAFVAVGLALLLQTQRWVILMKVQGIQLPWWRAWRLVIIGAFFNLFLLGATGGDVIKIYYAMRETVNKKGGAFLSVIVDRVIGLLALIAVATVICTINFTHLISYPLTRALLGSLAAILGGSLAIVLAGFVVDRLQLAHKLPHWLPMHARIIELASAFSAYTRALPALSAAFAISIPAHLLIFSTFYYAAKALTDQLDLMNVFSIMPIVSTITALPISLSGVGVREQLFQNLLGTLFGIPQNIAVLVSLIGFFPVLVWGLGGGLIYLFYRPTGINLHDIKHEVAIVEEDIERKA